MQEMHSGQSGAAGSAENPSGNSTALPGCPSCGRPTAASRPECLYCGELLRTDAAEPKKTSAQFTAADLSQSGYNLFALSGGDVVKAAEILSLEKSTAADLLAGPRFPAARTATPNEARDLAAELGAVGISCTVASDAELGLREPNVRVSAIRSDESGLAFVDFNTQRDLPVDPSEIVLIVEGIISTSRTDSVSKKRRPADLKGVRETVTRTDDPVLDIYTSRSRKGFRVLPSGFDFSYLGERKRLTAAENWHTLIEALAHLSPAAVLDREYKRIRRSLDAVWPVETASAFAGKVNSGFGRREFSSVASVSNLTQFNLYSRSRKYLL